MERTCQDLCEVPYSCWDSVQYALERLPAKAQDIGYGAAVSFTLLTRFRDRDTVIRELDNVTARQLETLPEEEKYAAWER